MIENIEDLTSTLIGRAREGGFKLQGPVATDLGWGGAPIQTLWYGDRRTHFYFATHRGGISVIVEAAEVAPEKRVRIGHVQTADEAWKIVDRFLRWKRSFDDLPDIDWLDDAPSVDGQIPHPPDEPNPNAVAATPLVAKMPPPARTPDVVASLVGAVQQGRLPRATTVAGILFYSADPSRLASWYRDLFGLELRRSGETYQASLGEFSFGIIQAEGGGAPAGRALLTFRVNDFDGFVLHLAEKGVGIEGLNATDQGKYAYVRDSDGNPVEIWGVK